MRASALARADGRSDTAPNAIASVSLVRAPSDDATTDAAVVRRFAAECVPANRDDATRADETRVGSKRAPSLLPHPLSRTARDFPRDTLPPIFAFDGATSACEVRLVLDPPETELAPPDNPKITKPRGAPRLSPRLPRLRPNPDANPSAPSLSRDTLATAERAARRVRRRRNRRATDDPRVDALVARVNAAIAAARSAPIPRCPDASSIDRLDRRPRDPNDSVDRDREDRDRRDREDRNRNRRDRDRDRDPNPPLAWIRRLVAFAESSPVFEPPAPGEPPPVYDRAAGAWIRALFPSTRDAVATRADVRLLERWLEQTVEGILDDDHRDAGCVDDDAKDTIDDDERARGTHRNTSARSVDTDSSAKERVSSSNPLSFATVATLCDGALWAHRAAFDALLRRVSSECRDRGRLLSRVWTRTVALVDARARADAESRWVAERARRCAAEEEAANARAALAETRDELRAETKRRRDETDALTASLSAASRRAEKIAASLRDAGRAESIAKASAESSAAAAAKARASRVAAESMRDVALAAANASRRDAEDARTALATARVESSRAALEASARIAETRETAIRVAGELRREIARGVVAETTAETIIAETSAALVDAETRAGVAEHDATIANRRAEEAASRASAAEKDAADASEATATERFEKSKAEAAFVAAADARDAAETRATAAETRADAAERDVATIREWSRRRIADAVAARISAEADAAAAKKHAEDARRARDDARHAADDADDEMRRAAERLAELEETTMAAAATSSPSADDSKHTVAEENTRSNAALSDRLRLFRSRVSALFRASSLERDALVRARVAAESSARRADARAVKIGAEAETCRGLVARLERRAAEAEKSSDARSRRLAESTSTAEALRSTVETLRSDVERKQTALRDVAAIREEEGRVAAERVEAAKREAKTAKREAKTAKREAKTAKREAKTLRDEVETLRDEKKTLRDEVETLHDEKKTLHDEKKTLRDEAKTLRDAISRLAEETVAVRLSVDDATRSRDALARERDALRDALATRPTRSTANRLRLRASLLSVTCGRLRRAATAAETREASRSADILRARATREMALLALARDFAEGETRAILAATATARDARALARDAAKELERLSRIRRVTDARLRRFDVAFSSRRDAAAQCDDASCRAWIDRATRVPVVETIETSRSIATVRIPGPILLDPRLVGRVFAETCATRLRLREGGATYRLEPRDPKQVTVFDCLAAAVDVLERIDRDGENRHGLISNENRHGLVSNENRHGLVSNENRHGLVSNENRHGLVSNENRHVLVSNSNAGPTEDSGSRSPGRLTPVDSRSPASLITVDSILASARYHAERGDAKCAAFARFTAMTPSTGTGRGSRRRPPFDASRLDAADPATRSAAFEAHCAFLDCARRLCANARSRAGVARGSNRDRRTDTLRALASWREGAVAVSRDDALDVLAAACHTHAPERLPAWRRAEEANARGGTSASEVDLDALLATLVDAWARGEAPADWATAPKRRRADERPEPTVVVPRVSKRLSTRTETG